MELNAIFEESNAECTAEFDSMILFDSVGQTTEAGGEIFNDYEKNEANAKYATAFGTESKAFGVASFASGAKQQHETDTPYPKDENGNEIIPDDAWRYNEAVGTASTAMGMGNVAFSRASKAFGFRTQTGYPPSEEWIDKRPEVANGIPHEDVAQSGGTKNFGVHSVQKSSFINFAYRATAPDPSGARAHILINFCDASGKSSSRYRDWAVLDGERHVVSYENKYGTNYVYISIEFYGGKTIQFTDMMLYCNAEENVGQAAVALGADTAALGNHAIAGGWRAIAKGYNSLALGSAETYAETPTEASGYGAVAIGKGAKASGSRAVAIGVNTNASGKTSTALGRDTIATGEGAFACGIGSKAKSYASVACGNESETNHVNSIAVGRWLITGKGNHAVFGQYNDSTANTDSLLTVGKGTSNTARGNAFDVKSNGNILVGGKSVHSGADYAEFFEWTDGNPNAEDRIGLVVALEGEKIRPAMPGDDVLGIVSGTAAVLGDSAAMYWKDKYLTDEFGRTICDMVEEFIELSDPETGEVVKESTGLMPQPRLNPNFDPNSTYIPREERKEWDQVGMMGKLYVRDDGTLAAGDYGCPGESGVLTKSESKTNIRVMKRTGDNIVLVLLK